MSRHVSPSILAADFANLSDDIEKVNRSRASWIHCDVMDGVFVPNISIGVPVIEAIARIARKPLDVHLMIVDPEKYIDTFCDIGIDILTVHQEAAKNLKQAIRQIKKRGVKAGVSISPDTPVSVLADFIGDIDVVLVMSVHPGFGGQQFIEQTYARVRETRDMIAKSHSRALIQVDGGVDLSNARSLFDAGVNILVTGTTVFHADDPESVIESLLRA